MEKTFWQDKIVFKEKINMKERQTISNVIKKRTEDKDEMQMTFDIFPVRVLSINGNAEMTDDQKKEWIENLTDLEMFKQIGETIWELQMQASWVDEKKKIDSVTNSTNWTAPEN